MSQLYSTMFLPPLSPSKAYQPLHHRIKSDAGYTFPPVLGTTPIPPRPPRLASLAPISNPRFYLEDTSLGSIKRRQSQVDKQLRKYQELKSKYDAIVNDRKRKSDMLKEIKSKYSVSLKRREVAGKTVEQLTATALEIANRKINNAAAKKIGKAWRERQWVREKRKAAARKIQGYWRKYLKSKLEKSTHPQKVHAALQIQRFWRGFRVRAQYGNVKKEVQMQATFHYFDSLRSQLLHSAAKTILRYWRKYRVRKAIISTEIPTSKVPTKPENAKSKALNSALDTETTVCMVYRSSQVFSTPS